MCTLKFKNFFFMKLVCLTWEDWGQNWLKEDSIIDWLWIMLKELYNEVSFQNHFCFFHLTVAIFFVNLINHLMGSIQGNPLIKCNQNPVLRFPLHSTPNHFLYVTNFITKNHCVNYSSKNGMSLLPYLSHFIAS